MSDAERAYRSLGAHAVLVGNLLALAVGSILRSERRQHSFVSDYGLLAPGLQNFEFGGSGEIEVPLLGDEFTDFFE